MSPGTCPIGSRAGWGQPFIPSRAEPENHLIKTPDGLPAKREQTPATTRAGQRCWGTKEAGGARHGPTVAPGGCGDSLRPQSQQGPAPTAPALPGKAGTG